MEEVVVNRILRTLAEYVGGVLLLLAIWVLFQAAGII